MRAAFITLGCKVNQYETSVMMQSFSASGFDIVEPGCEADVYIINSCTVTSSGDRKSRQAMRRIRRINPAAIICLTGCFPQAFPELAENIPEADIIFGAKNRSALLGAVKRRLAGEDTGSKIIEISPHEKGEEFEKMSVGADLDSRTRAFLKIEDGCERYCSYCIIPKARGPVRSKNPEDIKAELEGFAKSGYREAVLAGINLSSYGLDLGLRLIDAVKLACSVDGIERVRLGSLEPELLTAGDIEAMAGLPKLCPHFHLSLQSGCDETLTRMKRHYTTGEYADIVKNLRSSFDNCAITTDMMVGFPGESEEEHKQSMAFAEATGFAKAHIFAFSPRPGTLAAKMDGQIDRETKIRRSREMTNLTDKSRKLFLEAQTGKDARLLFETRENGVWKGYSENYTPVLVPEGLSGESLHGRIRGVSVTGVEGDFCTGWLL